MPQSWLFILAIVKQNDGIGVYDITKKIKEAMPQLLDGVNNANSISIVAHIMSAIGRKKLTVSEIKKGNIASYSTSAIADEILQIVDSAMLNGENPNIFYADKFAINPANPVAVKNKTIFSTKNKKTTKSTYKPKVTEKTHPHLFKLINK